MTAQTRIARVLALGCATAALTPGVATAMPAIDPATTRDAPSQASAAGVHCPPRGRVPAGRDCTPGANVEAIAVVLGGGALMAVAGGAAVGLRRARRGRGAAVTAPGSSIAR